MNDKQALAKHALAEQIGTVLTADLGIALRIRYVGSPESSANYADAVVVSATSITLSVNGVADDSVGASGVLAFATYTTLGTLVDAINLSDNWEARIVAGLRSDAINGSELLARLTSTFRAYQVIDLYWDSSAALHISYLLDASPVAFPTPGQEERHRVSLKRVVSLVNTSDSGAFDVTAYEVGPDKASALKTVYDRNPADNTEEDSGALDEPFVHAAWGNSILVRVTDASWQDSGAYLEVYGERE